ncbi:MAG TPA: SBBP repeat-containing protein [Acidimicrobiia bacterium]|nr:SBBP repeat-containing protein [Acidimicrobiia bacterium]
MHRKVLFPVTAAAVAVAALAALPVPSSADGPAPWMQQFGTQAPDDAEDVTVDSGGNVYVIGQTNGALPGQASVGMVDAYVRKYAAGGEELWTRQFGSFDRDFARGVAVDGQGDVYVVGQTFGTLPGQQSAGGFDAFVRKYDAAGAEIWTRQFGSSGGEGANSVAVDGAGNVFVVGSSRATMPGQVSAGEYDPYLRKYDSTGAELWTRQFGSLDDDFAVDVAVDAAGESVVVGQTSGTFPGQTPAGQLDGFIRRYDASGGSLWTHQFGSAADDRALSVTLDGAGDSYVVGSTNGSLTSGVSSGLSDAFLRKYDRFGGDVWQRQFGTAGADDAASVAVDGSGSIFTVGRTTGTFPGQRSAGDFDAYIRKLNATGAEQWTRQFGTSEGDYSLAVALDGAGVAHAVGGTLGVLTGQETAGRRDAFVLRLGTPASAAPRPPEESRPRLWPL